MISFCDKEVFTIYEKELDKGNLFSFFCKKENTTAIVLVIDYQDQFVGIITYERLLYSESNFIQKDTLCIGKDIWNQAYNIFEKDKNIIYIPVFDKNNELVYFCYKANMDREHDIKLIIDEFYENDNLLFIKELYPKITVVYLYDLNELSYKLYNLLIKREIPVVVVGDKWSIILEIDTKMIACPNFAKMNIYSEGTPLIIEENKNYYDKKRFSLPNAFIFLLEMAKANRILLENRLRTEYKKEGKKVYLCRLPAYHDLDNCTIDEEYRHLKSIKIFNDTLDFKNEVINNQIFNMFHMEYEKVKSILNEADTVGNNKKLGTEENIIYLVGPCIVDGHSNFEKEQLLYYLYENLKDNNLPYSVRGITLPEEQCQSFIETIASLSIRDKDIIIFIGQNYHSILKKFNVIDDVDLYLKDLFNTRLQNDTWFMDVPIHTTGQGNKAVAKELFHKIILPEISKMDYTKEPICLQRGKVNLSEKEKNDLKSYLIDIEKYEFHAPEYANIGSIVMNCNPLTLGHMYLIEYARSKVDYLYIFIVEEDRSFFKFEDRFYLVKKAVENMDNVKVIPSGQFILSNKTLPAYFTKEYKKEQIIDASGDIGIFAEYIAPAMKIKKRFVGEEPLDYITKQYNLEMRRTLSDYEIEFIEIPRKEISGEIVSASRVRKQLLNGNLDMIKSIVPNVTYEYLVNWKQVRN